jgi:TPR repeat/Glycosyltransferase family 9 (heptosyltransferase)
MPLRWFPRTETGKIRRRDIEAAYRQRPATLRQADDLYRQAVAAHHHGHHDSAIASIRQAIAINPKAALYHSMLASTLRENGQLDEAIASYCEAIALQPDLGAAHYNLATALLLRGEMATGWTEYEWRLKIPALNRTQSIYEKPRWVGDVGGGRTLLIHAEQGLGDTLQFCRYAPLTVRRGFRVIMAVPPTLTRLMSSLPAVHRIVACDEPPPAFDLHCPMLSLPLALGTTLDTIPNGIPYLHADPARIAAWAQRLDGVANRGPRIGIAWAGSATLAADRHRSLTPGRLAPLVGLPDVHFVSLQKGSPPHADLPLTDFMEEMADFAETAALIANLDLVISVDTAVVHLAGALGKPVWLLDRFDPCWRWLLGRRDSPWYPTLRLYRQRQPGDWEAVLAEVARDLREFAATMSARPYLVDKALST